MPPAALPSGGAAWLALSCGGGGAVPRATGKGEGPASTSGSAGVEAQAASAATKAMIKTRMRFSSSPDVSGCSRGAGRLLQGAGWTGRAPCRKHDAGGRLMRPLIALIALAAALAACSPPQQPTATPEAAPSATAAAFTAGDPPRTPGPGEGGALGSGCEPGGAALPDGAWFGYATAWDANGIEFDLACFYIGEGAAAQARMHNDESPPPNDFYVVNDNIATRRVAASADAVAYRLTSSDGPVGLERTTFGDLAAHAGPSNLVSCPGPTCPVWIFVNRGRVTEVMQQYFP
jgi:hypothetical protein